MQFFFLIQRRKGKVRLDICFDAQTTLDMKGTCVAYCTSSFTSSCAKNLRYHKDKPNVAESGFNKRDQNNNNNNNNQKNIWGIGFFMDENTLVTIL